MSQSAASRPAGTEDSGAARISKPPASLSEVHRSVGISDKVSIFKRIFAFAGPAYLISVGYMDPGNWATDLEGGSRFGYQLIWVLLMSNVMAVVLQTLCARLGIVTQRDLAQACREFYPRPISSALWVLCEIAIAACDLAEVLGTAIGLNLLFGIPMAYGVIITAADVLLLLYFQQLGIRKVEAFIMSLITVIGVCFLIEVFLAKPEWHLVAQGFIPSLPDGSLYIAIGILGATVMPHNLYLHSALVQTRAVGRKPEQIRQACRYNLIDSTLALNAAFFVNAAILVVAAAVFYRHSTIVTEIGQAHHMLTPLLGTSLAATAFGIALLASGQSSSLTGTLAGQVVMEGFIHLRMRPWVRRLVTRMIAIVPAAITVIITGDEGAYKLLILSQVILSLQLPFAVVPLINFTSDKRKMGDFANALWVKVLSWVTAIIIIGLNVKLVYSSIVDWVDVAGENAVWIGAFVFPVVAALALLLLYIIAAPLLRGMRQPAESLAPVFSLEELTASTYKLIGVSLEATDRDRAILSHAIPIAKQHGAELLLIHVAEGMGPRFWKSESSDKEVRSDSGYLMQLRDEIHSLGIKVDAELGFGEPADEIVRIAIERNVNLLVLGTHGHGFPSNLLFGTTAKRVRHAVRIPIFMVPTKS